MGAWWSGTLGDFRTHDPDAVLGALSTRLVETHSINRETQIVAWRQQIELLREATADLAADDRLLLEYPLLRLGRRIDAVLLTRRAIVVMEFKVGARTVTEAGRRQVEDYALDLQDFHAGSSSHLIVPILIATHARVRAPQWPLYWHQVTQVFDANAVSLRLLLAEVIGEADRTSRPIDVENWEAAPYRPVPGIVDAARMLYDRHGIADLRTARADVGNLTRTTDTIIAAVADARSRHRHVVIFVTGIPGAGKTLCGLNTVFATDAGAAFLTGNFPLVFVMRAALERDAKAQGRNARTARHETEGAIQPLMGFLRDNVGRTVAPHEHVIVFDEAQRAWDAAFGARKFGHPQSEAAMFLDIMWRHEDWAAIIALVGNGQEINTGEAGLATWGEALLQRPNWSVYAAPAAVDATNPRQRLFSNVPASITINPYLHLDVPVRSIKSTAAAPWVDAVVAGNASLARRIADAAGGVPFLVTRSLAAMRRQLRKRARGQRRSGLVCSAGARRLRADGIYPGFPHMEADTVANWFLAHWPDVRASDALEMPATQFACQGLELDYVGLCWGNDLIRAAGRPEWVARSFVGTRWQELSGEARVAYQVNTYRVLLTRARYATIIWVPEGDAADVTRNPSAFDAIAEFLFACGAAAVAEDQDEGPVQVEQRELLL
ncbi:MAG TPA: DNA/RNA helicase domain-containing protein [Rhodopila sp.]